MTRADGTGAASQPWRRASDAVPNRFITDWGADPP